ncbi:hypothetical protein GEMRC1_011701 [Eukaryota sp. GEM-RC1]
MLRRSSLEQSPSSKRLKITNAQKLTILSELNQPGVTVSSTAKKYGLDRKQLRQWRQQEVNIRNSDPKGFRISGGGRKLTSEEHEQKVIEQFIHLRAENKAVSATK